MRIHRTLRLPCCRHCGLSGGRYLTWWTTMVGANTVDGCLTASARCDMHRPDDQAVLNRADNATRPGNSREGERVAITPDRCQRQRRLALPAPRSPGQRRLRPPNGELT